MGGHEAYIGYCDLLGFSDRASAQPAVLTLVDYEAFEGRVDQIITNPGAFANSDLDLLDFDYELEHIVFPDFVLVYAEEATGEALDAVTKSVVNIIGVHHYAGHHVRGVVTRGNLYVRPDDRFVGQGYIRAHQLENIQDWAGGLFDDDAIDLERAPNTTRDCLVRYCIPLKESTKCPFCRAREVLCRFHGRTFNYALNWPLAIGPYDYPGRPDLTTEAHPKEATASIFFGECKDGDE